MRENRTLRAMWRGLETQTWLGLRHRHVAKAAGNSYSPYLPLPRQPSTLPAKLDEGSPLYPCHPTKDEKQTCT